MITVVKVCGTSLIATELIDVSHRNWS